MNREKDYIDNYFAELGNLEITPPHDVWERIEETLHKRKVRIIRFWTSIAAGLAFIASVGGYMLMSDIDKTNPELATVYSQQEIKQKINPTAHNDKRELNQYIKREKLPEQNSSTTIQLPQQEEIISSLANQNGILPSRELSETSNIPVVRSSDVAASSTHDKIGYLSSLQGYAESDKVNASIIIETEDNETEEPAKINPANQEEFFIADINIQENSNRRKWALSGQVAPLYSYRKYSQPGSDQNHNEKGLVAYSGGLKVDYSTGQRLSFQTGVYVAVMGQVVEQVKANYAVSNSPALENSNSITSSSSNSFGPISNHTGTLYTVGNSTPVYENILSSDNYFAPVPVDKENLEPRSQNIEEGEIRQEIQFIEVPFLARYKVINSKVGLHVLGGVTTHFLVSGSSVFLPEGGIKRKVGETKELTPVNYSTTFGFGICYQISSKMDFSLEPTYKYYINSFSANKEKDVHPYSFGIFTGFSFKF